MLRMIGPAFVSGVFAFGGLTAALAQAPATAPSTRAAAGPLAPGGAAGIRQAQAQQNNLRNFIPLAVVGGLALLVVVTGNNDDDSTTTTTGTN